METSGEFRDVGFEQLEPEIVLPEQFLDGLHRRSGRSPEYNLVVALLCDALHCFRKNLFAETAARRQLFRDAESWFMDRNSGAPLEFEDVCDVLGLDQDTIRRRLGSWREQGLTRPNKRAAVILDPEDDGLLPEPSYRRAVGE